MKRNLYLVDREKIDNRILELGLSNTMVAELMGQKPKSRAIEVNIGAIRRGKILSCELSFINKLEEILKLPKDSTALSHIEKKEVQQKVKAKEYQINFLRQNLKELLSQQVGDSVTVGRKTIEDIILFI